MTDCSYLSFRYFDKDKDGFLTVPELRKIMTSMGDRMSKREFEAMVQEADRDNDGLINCKGRNYLHEHYY